LRVLHDDFPVRSLLGFACVSIEQGRIIRWYCQHTDIDDRKRVEQARRASELNAGLVVSIPGLVNLIL
jgi:hypothetical protein